jgi:hypothetical protein
LVVQSIPVNGSAEDRVRTCVKDLQAQGFTNALVVLPNTYPKLKLTATSPELRDTWLAVLGPYNTSPEAAAPGDQAGKICGENVTFPVQPDPPS